MDYEKLEQRDSSSEASAVWQHDRNPPIRHSITKRALYFGHFTLLFVSICLNSIFVYDWSRHSHAISVSGAACPAVVETAAQKHPLSSWDRENLNLGQAPLVEEEISPYAGVARDQLRPLVEHTSYHNPENWTKAHEMWKAMDINWGVVALHDDFVKEKHMLTSQRFPWDESKGIYVLHGMHNLHCLRVMFLEYSKYENGGKATVPWEHISHCFDSIRQQLVCDADDTPRASYAGQEGVSGIGQSRRCRNWDAYEAFAKEHTACYYRSDTPDNSKPDIELYKHCPPGSGYIIKDDGSVGSNGINGSSGE